MRLARTDVENYMNIVKTRTGTALSYEDAEAEAYRLLAFMSELLGDGLGNACSDEGDNG